MRTSNHKTCPSFGFPGIGAACSYCPGRLKCIDKFDKDDFPIGFLPNAAKIEEAAPVVERSHDLVGIAGRYSSKKWLNLVHTVLKHTPKLIKHRNDAVGRRVWRRESLFGNKTTAFCEVEAASKKWILIVFPWLNDPSVIDDLSVMFSSRIKILKSGSKLVFKPHNDKQRARRVLREVFKEALRIMPTPWRVHKRRIHP